MHCAYFLISLTFTVFLQAVSAVHPPTPRPREKQPSQNSNRSPVLRPNHTGIVTTNTTRALQFWQGVLGLGERYTYTTTGPPISHLIGSASPDLKVQFTFLTLPGGHLLELTEFPELSAQRTKVQQSQSWDVGMWHFSLDVAVGSLEGIVEGAQKIGWKVVNVGGKIVRLEDGRRAVYLRDVDGDGGTVELFEAVG